MPALRIEPADYLELLPGTQHRALRAYVAEVANDKIMEWLKKTREADRIAWVRNARATDH